MNSVTVLAVSSRKMAKCTYQIHKKKLFVHDFHYYSFILQKEYSGVATPKYAVQ